MYVLIFCLVRNPRLIFKTEKGVVLRHVLVAKQFFCIWFNDKLKCLIHLLYLGFFQLEYKRSDYVSQCY